MRSERETKSIGEWKVMEARTQQIDKGKKCIKIRKIHKYGCNEKRGKKTEKEEVAKI